MLRYCCTCRRRQLFGCSTIFTSLPLPSPMSNCIKLSHKMQYVRQQVRCCATCNEHRPTYVSTRSDGSLALKKLIYSERLRSLGWMGQRLNLTLASGLAGAGGKVCLTDCRVSVVEATVRQRCQCRVATTTTKSTPTAICVHQCLCVCVLSFILFHSLARCNSSGNTK